MKYEYGVEYETNGEKPDLPDDVAIYCLSKLSGYWLPCKTVGSEVWRNTEKFKIIDLRYKQNENNMDDWYKKGELPPVGAVVELLWGGVSQGEIEIVSYRNNGNTVVFWRLDKDHVDAAEIPTAEFRPIRSETDKLIEQAKAICKSWNDSCGKSIPELFVEANWRPIKPMTEDEFVQTTLKSFDSKRLGVSQLKLICESLRKLHKDGCRFIEQGE